MKRMTFLLATISILFLFAGCGQSGPLYIPGNPSTMAVPPSNPPADEDEQEDSDSDDAAENQQ